MGEASRGVKASPLAFALATAGAAEGEDDVAGEGEDKGGGGPLGGGGRGPGGNCTSGSRLCHKATYY